MRPRYIVWNLLLSLLILVAAALAFVAWVRFVAWCVLLARHWGWL